MMPGGIYISFRLQSFFRTFNTNFNYNMSNKLAQQLRRTHLRLEEKLNDSNGVYTGEIQRLISELKSSVRILSSKFSNRRLRRMLGALAVFVGLNPFSMKAQGHFLPYKYNPFNIEINFDEAMTFDFVDIDGDGDEDLFLGGVSPTGIVPLTFLENTGTATSPWFAESVVYPFNIPTADDEIIILEFADIDNDGDQDLFYGSSGEGKLSFVENMGDPQNPLFTEAVLAEEFISEPIQGDISLPVFFDVDADGDEDLILIDEYDLKVSVYINETIEPGELDLKLEDDISQYNIPEVASSLFAFADVDGDGDKDLFYGDYAMNLIYHENTAAEGEAAYFEEAVDNPFNFSMQDLDEEGLIIPEFADIDGDGDEDLFVSVFYPDNRMFFFRNGMPSSTGDVKLYEGNIKAFPNPSTESSIQLEADEAILAVDLISTLGRQTQLTLTGNTLYFPSDLAKGHYVLRIQMDNGQFAFKQIVRN